MVCTINRTQHCKTLWTKDAEYVAMVAGVEEGLFFRSVVSFMHPRVAFLIKLLCDARRVGMAACLNICEGAVYFTA